MSARRRPQPLRDAAPQQPWVRGTWREDADGTWAARPTVLVLGRGPERELARRQLAAAPGLLVVDADLRRAPLDAVCHQRPDYVVWAGPAGDCAAVRLRAALREVACDPPATRVLAAEPDVHGGVIVWPVDAMDELDELVLGAALAL